MKRCEACKVRTGLPTRVLGAWKWLCHLCGVTQTPGHPATRDEQCLLQQRPLEAGS